MNFISFDYEKLKKSPKILSKKEKRQVHINAEQQRRIEINGSMTDIRKILNMHYKLSAAKTLQNGN